MASPEATRAGGSRPSGAGGVKGLLAMFEKSNPASPAPTNGSTTAGTSSRDQSPAGPKPLSKVKTSFVAVTGSNNGLLGLQKVPVSPSVTSPTVTFPEGQKLSGEALEALGKEHPAIDTRDQIAEALNGVRTPDELNSKKDFGIINGGRFSQPKQEPVKPTVLLPAFEKVSTKKDETPVPIEPLREEDGGKKEEQAKPAKQEPKPKSSTVKGAPAPRSPTKSASSSRTAKSVTANKSGKTLSLPPSKSNTTSPLPSPAFPPKSPARNTASSSSSLSRTKPTTSATNTTSASSRARTPAAPSTPTLTSTAPKPRSATTTAKAKAAATTQKPEVAKPAREPTKPPTIRSSAFAPTAASAAARNNRAPSSASVRNRSPPEGSVAMRRGNSGTGSSRPGRKEQRSPQRPQTSAAIRNPNRSSAGSVASIAPAGAGGDFLSRMMRPTTASAGKVSDKKPAIGVPSKRSASVASTSRRREPSLPPSKTRLVKQKTGEKTEVAQEALPEGKESIAEAAQESKAETPEEPAAPGESAEPAEEVVEQAPVEQADAEEASVGKTPVAIEVSIAIDEVEVNGEDEGQSPTTTTSSTTLVHEGEGKDCEEPAPLVKE